MNPQLVIVGLCIFLGISLVVIAFWARREDVIEQRAHETRAYELRVIATIQKPCLDLPIKADFPAIHETRSTLFHMTEAGAHIVRMDARELTPEELDRLRNNNYQPPRRRFQWALLAFWATYLATSAVFLAWLAGFF